MLDKPSINRLPGDRLQLRHGPVAIQLKVWAEPDIVRQAHRLVMRHFPKIIPALEDDLEALGAPVISGAPWQSKTATMMAEAVLAFGASDLQPVRTMAGAVADEVLRIVLSAGPIHRAYVTAGGYTAYHVAAGHALLWGAGGDLAAPDSAGWPGSLTLTAGLGFGGIACAGHTSASPVVSDVVTDVFSHGFSLDRVTVLAATAAMAAAGAALIVNAVAESTAVSRHQPGSKVDPTTDPGITSDGRRGRPLPVKKIRPLSSDQIDLALTAGESVAEVLRKKGLIGGAILQLQDDVRTAGPLLVPLIRRP